MLSSVSTARRHEPAERADLLIEIRALSNEIRAMETRAYELRIEAGSDPFGANFFLAPLLKHLERNKTRMTELCSKVERLCETCMLAHRSEVYGCKRHV